MAKILKALLDNEGDPNVRDSLKGYTPLHYAAENDHLGCVQELLKYGANLHLTSFEGTSVHDVANGLSREYILNHLPCTKSYEVQISHRDQKKNQSPIEEGLENSATFKSSQYLNSHIGVVNLSFEYHAKKRILKVRIWKLDGICLPVRDSSSIGSLQIKGRIYNSTKTTDISSKTECISAYSSNVTSKTSEFYIAHYEFNQAMEFCMISSDIIKNSNIRISLHVNHKLLTIKSYEISQVILPLDEWALKLYKEKVILTSSWDEKLPSDMQVFGVAAMIRKFDKEQDIISCARSEKIPRHLIRERPDRNAISATDLKAVISVSSPSTSSDSISVDLTNCDNENDDMESSTRLESVVVRAVVHRAVPRKRSTFSITMPTVDDLDDTSLEEVIHINNSNEQIESTSQRRVNIPGKPVRFQRCPSKDSEKDIEVIHIV